MEKATERESNIELMRIVVMLGVIVLHYNNQDIGGGFLYVAQGSANQILLHVLENMAICAVNAFILITGYFMCTTDRRSWKKAFELLLQVILFKMVVAVLVNIAVPLLTDADIGNVLRPLLVSLVPNNYFVILYIVLYVISPYINRAIRSLSAPEFKKLIITAVVLFSVWPTLVDLFTGVTGCEWPGLSSIGINGSQGGYTIVNFVLMYLIGAYLRLAEERVWDSKKLLAVFFAVVLALTLWSVGGAWTASPLESMAREYCNPLVVLSAVLLFLLFHNWKIKTSRVINGLARASFTVYLLHDLFLPYIRIQQFAGRNIPVLCLHIAASCVMIYLICWCVYWFYQKIMTMVFRLTGFYG